MGSNIDNRRKEYKLVEKQALEQMAAGLEDAISAEGGLAVLEFMTDSALDKFRALILDEMDKRGEEKANRFKTERNLKG